ncbi:MAG: M28 family peptidase [Candidatus Hydrogenedentes bacterium]|nr:M28 family peptidase [Candidatus Hydrogenedentota bacterium]
MRRCIVQVALLLIVCSSCAHFGSSPVKSERKQRLQEHVQFLAAPKLGGRKPVSSGSRLARRYIARRFRDCGLLAWGDGETYEQSVKFGTNVVGLLPGTDKDLMDEIVLVCAHYDHLGGGKLGAADNASGVAVLLETADRMTSSGTAPRRSVCFAAFDCEESMLWGAVAFTCRDDFDPSRIAAVINIDTLGRRAFDVLDNVLFLGCSSSSELKQAALSASEGSIQLIPCGAHLIGPRGDHFPFAALGLPVYFFSNGLFRDYHTTKDTSTGLDYDLLSRSAHVIYEVVSQAASMSVPDVPAPVDSAFVTTDDILALKRILSDLVVSHEQTDLSSADVGEFELTLREIERALNDNSDALEKDSRLMRSCLRSAFALLSRYDKIAPVDADAQMGDLPTSQMQNSLATDNILQSLFVFIHRKKIMNIYQHVAKELLEGHRFATYLEGPPDFDLEEYDLLPEEVRITAVPGNKLRLSVAFPHMYARTYLKERITLPPKGLTVGCRWDFHTCLGTAEELLDYCLLQWRRDIQGDGYGGSWAKVLSSLFPEAHIEGNYHAWFQWSRQSRKVASEEQWLIDCLESGNPELMRAVLTYFVPSIMFNTEYPNLLRRIMTDTTLPGELRALAVAAYGRKGDKVPFGLDRPMLLDLVSLLDDGTVVCLPKAVVEAIVADFPLLGFAVAEGGEQDTLVLGEYVADVLHGITKQSFGGDAALWNTWIKEEDKTDAPMFITRKSVIAVLPFQRHETLVRNLLQECDSQECLLGVFPGEPAIQWECSWVY